MDLIDSLKNKSGSSGYDRTTDSLEGLGDKTSGGLLGADGKALISSDVQDLSDTLSVNAKKLNGVTPNNLAAGAKMDIQDVPNPTAITAIQLGLSKPGTAQTITPPADMALNSTVAKDATVSKPGIAQTITPPTDMALNSTVAKDATVSKPGIAQIISSNSDITGIKSKVDNLPLSPAATGDKMDLIDSIKNKVGSSGYDRTTDSLEALGEGDVTAAEVWQYGSRTLTQMSTAVEIIPPVLDGTTINIYNDTTIGISLTGLGSLAGNTEIYMTCKSNPNVPDANAIFQISKTAGLKYLYQTKSPTAGDGVLAVSDVNVGNIVITLQPLSSAILPAMSNLFYDIKMITSSGAFVLTSGKLNILQTITQAVS
jgi:hypothetical protein